MPIKRRFIFSAATQDFFHSHAESRDVVVGLTAHRGELIIDEAEVVNIDAGVGVEAVGLDAEGSRVVGGDALAGEERLEFLDGGLAAGIKEVGSLVEAELAENEKIVQGG